MLNFQLFSKEIKTQFGQKIWILWSDNEYVLKTSFAICQRHYTLDLSPSL